MGTVFTRNCSVMFVDLRGSTAFFLHLGNTQATSLVTHSTASLAKIVQQGGGNVIKTLGDGLMAVFDNAEKAVDTAKKLQNSLNQILPNAPLLKSNPVLNLKIALTWGEIVDVAGDCYGDAVNLASRVLDLAGDQETLVTDSFVNALPKALQQQFRKIDRLHLRGRIEPVAVLCLVSPGFSDTELMPTPDVENDKTQECIKLLLAHTTHLFTQAQLPLFLGRHPQAHICVERSHVSRSHAKIEGYSSHYNLVDLSYNGTYLQFDHEKQVLLLRREHCTLHGSGYIWLGAPPNEAQSTKIRFELLRQPSRMRKQRQSVTATQAVKKCPAGPAPRNCLIQ